MFVADRTADRIVRFDGVSGAYEGEVVAIDRPSSTRLGTDGALYVAGFGRSEIVRVDPHTGAILDRFYRDTTVLEEPVELLFRAGQLVVLGHDTKNAVVIDPSGTMVTDLGYPDMRSAHDFAFASDGLLYVATGHDVSTGSALQAWDLERGVLVDRFGGLDEVANATGIVAVGEDLFVTDYERGTLLRVAPDRSITVVTTGLVHPISVELGLDDSLYLIDDWGIQRFDQDGAFLQLLVPRSANLVGARSLTLVPRDAL